jgi:hypothetical protein
MSSRFTPKGHDGKTIDLPCKPNIPHSPVISKIPYQAFASSQCGRCGIRDVLTGRPGTVREYFQCRSCAAVNSMNGGIGFKFEGWN